MMTLTLSVLQLCCICWVSVIGSRFYARKLQLFPKDPVACVSQNITFQCSNSHVNMRNLDLVFAKPKEQETVININGTQVNETTYEHTLYNVSLEDDHLYMYCCYTDCNNSNYDVQKLRVHRMPEPVNKFRCVIYNWDAYMNCSWDLAHDYNGSVNVTIQWMIPTFKVWNLLCLENHLAYCIWNKTDMAASILNKTIKFQVIVKSACGENATSDHSVDTVTIVKPDAVVNLRNRVDNSSCVTLMWNVTRIELPMIYILNYTSRWRNHTFQHAVYDTAENVPRSKSVIVCDLHPHSNYTFTVQVLPVTKGLLSDPVSTSAQTYQDFPSASPELKAGGYMWNPQNCTQLKNSRLICIYWKPVPEEFKNGLMKGTRMIIEPKLPANNRTENAMYDIAVDVTHACYNLECDQHYNISIFALNVNGSSKNGSSLHIPKAQPSLQPECTVEMSNNEVYVEWRLPDVNVQGYTVFWCKKLQGNCDKNCAVDWSLYDGSSNHAMLAHIRHPEEFVYGVSMDTEHGSSGLSWQSCIYSRNVALTRCPMNITVAKGQDDHSLEISWDKLMCESGQPLVNMYKVHICRELNYQTCKDDKYMEVSAEENRLVAADLMADNLYQVKVRGVTKGGLEGPWSETKIGKTVEKGLNTKEIAGLVVSGVFIMALAIAGFVFCFRHCIKRGKNMCKIAITMPFHECYQAHIPVQHISIGGVSNGIIPPQNSRQDLQNVSLSSCSTVPPSEGCVPNEYSREKMSPVQDIQGSLAGNSNNIDSNNRPNSYAFLKINVPAGLSDVEENRLQHLPLLTKINTDYVTSTDVQ